MRPFVAVATALSLGRIAQLRRLTGLNSNGGTGSTAYGAISKQSPADGVYYSLSIPDSTASSGIGDIYIQISAVASQYSWVALGQGSGMRGANIFVVYTSGNGKNVTVSPRLGTGYVEPQYNPDSEITVLEGSGVENGLMTANILCKDCNAWKGGQMDFSNANAMFLYAVKAGAPLNSDSLDYPIEKHDDRNAFTWPISAARGGSENVNPFVAPSGSGSGNDDNSDSGEASPSIPVSCTPIAASSMAEPTGRGCPTTWPAAYSTSWPATQPAWVTACYPSGLPADGFPRNPSPTNPPQLKVKKRDDGCPAGYALIDSSDISEGSSSGLSASQSEWMPIAHGVLASLAFVGLFPIGGILIRVANFTGLVWIHAALQLSSYLVYIVAFGMGIYMAQNLGYMTQTHPIIGIVLFAVLLIQPVFGFIHHKVFKKTGERSIWSYLHLFTGRIAILLGMVNGGLGLQLVGNASIGAKAAYAVVTTIMALVYAGAMIMGELRRNRDGPTSYEKSQKAQELRDMSSEENVRVPRHQQEYQYYGGGGIHSNRF